MNDEGDRLEKMIPGRATNQGAQTPDDEKKKFIPTSPRANCACGYQA